MAVVRCIGAAGTVTGSQYLVESERQKVLIDAGLFQGSREWREKNRLAPPYDVRSIGAVLLTHAHIDHIGLLPRLRALGLNCPVYCSEPTAALARIILLDSAALQKEEASFRKKTGRSRHEDPEPLYTEQDVINALELIRTVEQGGTVDLGEGAKALFSQTGHILGSCAISLDLGGARMTFSGDVGRYGVPILKDPSPVEMGDLFFIESTYGNRLHSDEDPRDEFSKVIRETAKRDGTVLIPSFSVGRVQLLLFYLREMKAQGRIPDIPVIVDSPMASDATAIYSRYPQWYDEESLGILKSGNRPFDVSKLYFTRDREESKKLNSIHEAMIIISGNGMLSGGRVLHHLLHRLSDSRNSVLFVGYQPSEGRGAWLLRGAPSIRIMAEEVAVRAQIHELSGLSAHADKNELLKWCRESKGRPRKVLVTHGEVESARAFAGTLRAQLGWNALAGRYMEEISAG